MIEPDLDVVVSTTMTSEHGPLNLYAEVAFTRGPSRDLSSRRSTPRRIWSTYGTDRDVLPERRRIRIMMRGNPSRGIGAMSVRERMGCAGVLLSKYEKTPAAGGLRRTERPYPTRF